MMKIIGFREASVFEEKNYLGGNILYFRPDDEYLDNNFIKFLKTYNFKDSITITIYLNNHNIVDLYKELFNLKFNLVLKSWDTYFMYQSLNFITISQTLHTPLNIKKFCTSLNSRPTVQRCKFIDELAKLSLVGNNYITWNSLDYKCDYKFKYFDGKKISIEADKKIIIDTADDFLELPFPVAALDPPKEAFNNSLWSLVCEYMNEKNSNYTQTLTEKTWLPVAHKRPFISLGAKGINRNLEDLGFALYDEVIDYSFDDIEDFDDRLVEYMKQVEYLSNLNLKDTYDLLFPKILFNYKKMREIVNAKIISIYGDVATDEELYNAKKLEKDRGFGKAPLFDYLISKSN